ncbi:Transposase DDE domain-containing protein [Methylobacterium pseudosasicola]|uniref:Transposase DDE domain-containing protein n=1 Tax=Methylobacterium pseudosasicola TaxID=582667 RepID=A0A1I4M5S2_9HYPH|nr:Transposase DDE domain-containing protein [Methylobacterium pseudosasicola]
MVRQAHHEGVALVDAEGHVLAVAVVPADVQDRDTLSVLDDGKEQWPSLFLAILDGAFTAERCREWCHIPGMRHRVVEKEPDQTSVVVLERRRVVERTFGWLGRWGGLLRERAGRLDVTTGRLACLASLMAARAFNNPARDQGLKQALRQPSVPYQRPRRERLTYTANFRANRSAPMRVWMVCATNSASRPTAPKRPEPQVFSQGRPMK